MAERLVRFHPAFFEDLDRLLPSERTASGRPSSTDFLLYDLPPIRDLLAEDVVGSTVSVPGVGELRVFLGTATLVRAVAVYVLVADDGAVDVVGLDLDTGLPDGVDAE